MDNPIKVSVLVCTYNRAETLARTIESVVAQAVPESFGWELVIVDNNSSDQTLQVIEEFRRRYPERIRYVFEAQQGISHARNAGIRESRGEVVAFIDDDETAEAAWLQNLTVNLHSGEWAGAGGRIVAQWNCPRPKWLSTENSFTLGPLAAWDAGREACELSDPPVGANMAYRKEMFEKYGGFRTDLGRVGKALLHSEDIEFGRRLMCAGLRLRYEPSAVTHHPVEQGRVNKKYFLKWWFNKGRSDVREYGIQASAEPYFEGLFKLFRDAAVEAARWTVSAKPSERFVCKLKVWAYAGQAFEFYQLRKAKGKQPERKAHLQHSPPSNAGAKKSFSREGDA